MSEMCLSNIHRLNKDSRMSDTVLYCEDFCGCCGEVVTVTNEEPNGTGCDERGIFSLVDPLKCAILDCKCMLECI